MGNDAELLAEIEEHWKECWGHLGGRAAGWWVQYGALGLGGVRPRAEPG